MLVRDQLNRELSLDTTPKRIISIVPSQTELLYDLGLKTSLVGLTKFCVHPAHLRKEIQVVGGTKNVNFDVIKTLRPDIIIANKEENTREIVEGLEEIAPVWVSDISSIDQSLEMIASLGELFSVSKKAESLIASISSEREQFESEINSISVKKVAYLIWKDPFMAAGCDTFINELLTINKFENIIKESRYPELNIDKLKETDLILLSSEPFPFKQKHVETIHELTGVPVKLVDGEYFSWYGSRLKNAFHYFRGLH